MTKPRRRRRRVRRVTVVVPSIFTLTNLFFGIWSMVLAAQGEFYIASWLIVVAGVLDMLDGRIARMSNTGTDFGAELDSLVDLVSFGVAPAILIIHMVLLDLGPYSWVFGFGFVAAVALRLARFNLQSSPPGSSFTGLPSPAAGMTLATYYPFSQTDFYQSQLAELPWTQILIVLTIALGMAMLSNISYARLPRIGYRSLKGVMGLATHLLILGFALWERDIFFFPFGLTYVSYGMARAVVVGLYDRSEESEPGHHQDPSVVSMLDSRSRKAGNGE